MIFVTHAWINNEPDDKVLQLVASLRDNGYDAYCDVKLTGDRNSIHFKRMMAENMQKAEKVIVVLSENYKVRADTYKGGVGTEYQYILDDIDVNEMKYILVSFQDDREKVTPDFLRGREIVFLQNDLNNKLLHRLTDTPEYIFPEVNPNKKEVKAKVVNPLISVAETKPIKKPCIQNLLYIKNQYFQGREKIIEAIHNRFVSEEAISCIQSITGLGGVGKTQIALEYAHRYKGEYDVIWWINAESSQTILEGFQKFVVKMGMNPDTLDEEFVISLVMNWMDENTGWLFIYDNVEDNIELEEYLPKGNIGNILITTRKPYLHIGKMIELDVFTEEESVKFLIERTQKYEVNENQQYAIALLSERLGNLPLALEQAGAYIVENQISYEDYLNLLREYGLAIFEKSKKVKNYNFAITTTWSISIKKIKNDGAVQLLNLFAYFAPENINLNWIKNQNEILLEPLKGDSSNPIEFNEIINQLASYSLIKRKGNMVTIHRLLQEVICDDLKKKENDSFLINCLKIISNTFKNDYNTSEGRYKFLKCVSHALAITDKAYLLLPDDNHQQIIADLYQEIGEGFFEIANYTQSIYNYDRTLYIREKILGKEHLDTAAIYNDIALVYSHQGEYGKALEWNQKTLAICEKVLGKEHLDTAITYSNIALVYSRQGDYPKALEWNQKALLINEKVLGKEHPDTGAIYNNMAGVYSQQGLYPKALEGVQKALSICEKVLGKEHPATAATYNNIADSYYHKGNYLKALEWYQKALSIYEKILGKEHPDTATTYNSIALIYYYQGDYQKALKWYQKALSIREKVLGKEHPDTATTYNGIALVYFSEGEFSKALEWYQKALSINEKVLGKEHPATDATYNNIALIYSYQGEYGKALEWNQKALSISEKVLGKEHPATATTYDNIALVYSCQGEYSKALEWFQKALSINERLLGKEHPETAVTYNNIAGVYASQGEGEKAMEWYNKAIKIFEHILGKKHPDTKMVKDNMSNMLH